MNPKVTVLMSVYNGEKYLREAIDSILSQTFRDFEFLIINDGSTDTSVEIINAYTDPRIQLVHNDSNLGQAATMNRGLDLAHGEYIARMDCDDISLSMRLEKQVRFMDENPEVTICGAWCRVFGAEQNAVWKYPLSADIIRTELLFSCAMVHPSVIMRRYLLDLNRFRYSESHWHAEDYELWARASESIKLANLGEVLILYRVHADQLGSKYTGEQQKTAYQVRLKQLHNMGIEPTTAEMDLHQSIGTGNFIIERDFVEKAEFWLMKILMVNNKRCVYPEKTLTRVVAQKWFTVCRSSVCLGLWVYFAYVNSPLSAHYKMTFQQRIGFWGRCILYEAVRWKHNP